MKKWRAPKVSEKANGGSLPFFSGGLPARTRVMQNSSLVKDSFIYSLGAFLIKAFGFFLIPIYTRFLTVEEYGSLALLNVILQLASFVLLLGVSSASMRLYFSAGADEGYRKQVYGNALILLLIFPTVLFLLTLPIGYSLSRRLLPAVPYFPYIFVILLVALCDPVQKLVLGLMRVRRQAKNYVIYTMSLFILETAAVIVAVVVLKKGLKGVVYSQFVAAFIFSGIAAAAVAKFARFSYSKTVSKSLFLFGVPLIPFFIFMWINEASGRFMLERYASLRDLGIFALAVQFSNMLSFLGSALENSMLPYFYETAQNSGGPDVLGRFAGRYFVLFGLVSLLTFAVAQPLVLVAADAKFHEAIVYIPLIVLVGWLNINFNIFYWSLMHSKKTSIISGLVGTSAFLMIVLLYVFLKELRLGIWGVIYAMVAVALGKIAAGYLISQRYFRLRLQLPMIGYAAGVIILGAAVIDRLARLDLSLIFSAPARLGVFALTALWVFRIIKVDPLQLFYDARRGLLKTRLTS
jgi:O-antigen/teichoic acid export membrane protein